MTSGATSQLTDRSAKPHNRLHVVGFIVLGMEQEFVNVL